MSSGSCKVPVPTVVVEEHHEAFYLWHYAIDAGWLQPTGNVLLHIDEHHDLWRPYLTRSIASLKTLADIGRFTYQDLRIGNFICPAIWEGIFDSMFWMRYGYDKSAEAQLWSIWPKDNQELEFIARMHRPADNLAVPRNAMTMKVVSLGPRDRLRPDHSFVLDVDLDYFACNKKPDWKLEVEITAAAYAEFHSNPYHVLRLPSDRVLAKKRNGSHFLVFNGMSGGGDDATVASVDERIALFSEYLSAVETAPRLICICRSVYSGYTPRRLATYIEESVLKVLSDRFSLQRVFFEEILPQEARMANLIVA